MPTVLHCLVTLVSTPQASEKATSVPMASRETSTYPILCPPSMTMKRTKRNEPANWKQFTTPSTMSPTLGTFPASSNFSNGLSITPSATSSSNTKRITGSLLSAKCQRNPSMDLPPTTPKWNWTRKCQLTGKPCNRLSTKPSEKKLPAYSKRLIGS